MHWKILHVGGAVGLGTVKPLQKVPISVVVPHTNLVDCAHEFLRWRTQVESHFLLFGFFWNAASCISGNLSKGLMCSVVVSKLTSSEITKSFCVICRWDVPYMVWVIWWEIVWLRFKSYGFVVGSEKLSHFVFLYRLIFPHNTGTVQKLGCWSKLEDKSMIFAACGLAW